MDFAQLVDESAWILHGRVVDMRVESSGRFLWTHYRVQVLDALKGSYPSEITVSEPGGTLNGVSMDFPGVVVFRPGEEVVLFLYRTPVGYWRTTGYWQGKFEVSGPAAGKRVRVNREAASAVDLAGRAAGRALETFDGLTLEEFKAAIRRQVGR